MAGVPPNPSTAAGRTRVLLCGYYGEHNLGDDALLRVLLEQLPPGCTPVVTARDEEQIQRQFGVETTDRRRLRGVLAAMAGCDALVLGGGSLLQDATSFRSLLYYAALIVEARLRGRPVLLWGQGLGPLDRQRSRILARGLLRLATGISWRDPASATLASSWRVEGALGSDPVWALEPMAWEGRGGPIVLCWRPVHQLEQGGWAPYLGIVDRMAEEEGREVLWLPFHRDQDGGLLNRLVAEGVVPPGLRSRSREVAAADPAEAMAHFRTAGLVLAMRLHGLILAALSGSPCAALSYDPKVAAAAAGLGCPCQDLSTAPSRLLAQEWRGCLDRPSSPKAIKALRRSTGVHRRLLATLVRPGVQEAARGSTA